MKKLSVAAIIPLFACGLYAQTEQTTTTITRWNGNLVDAGCYTTHTKETSSNPEGTVTTTRRTMSTECPVTTTTTTFGLVTPKGEYVTFDETSNTRIVEMTKSNKHWHTFIENREPFSVRVVGKHHGNVVVMESIH